MKTFSVGALLVTIFGGFFGGCMNSSGVVQLSPDTYMISRTDTAGVFGNASNMKMNVIREANAFAARQGKVAIPISSNFTPMVIAQNCASFDYEFRVVDKNDAEAKRTSLLPAPTVIQKMETVSGEIHTKNESVVRPDLYSELMKLDDLRKRGILTDAEFEAEKRKLLDQSK